ncbi:MULTISPECIES: tryptophan synthase subunit alpha [Brevibacillus]|uniref:Tryptophan synthase alpha chain n=1 Tax=Brevibacillus invocatus TaxID=173959 RepID=A0A3M8CIC0_9BACL|nr:MULTISPECIES: tryptophan synthase subunit alpha [Brevibacillus]MCM3077884.1 tryptophan synthase subunit alpha [Brevibacillus invocatus]MCM3428042.1 tryptophan synthase subunit alpha [Brevibacillus invocatus]MDH4616027.1 tryptophan synthase subunit alpha [Brevibacillus sp. AY1]RNB75338.1 tryptophan synthase subunit alpha [Brevibacillus invocatus]
MTTIHQNRIDHVFADRSRKRFIPFITVGDPTLEVTYKIAHALVEAGADILELGIPYSDPLADGPTIQQASQRALKHGVAIKDALQLVVKLRASGMEAGLVLFSYVNPVFQYGIERFFADLAASGADGVVIPDLPVEESGSAIAAAKKHGVHVISLVAPTSQTRIRMIGEQATGFLYCVSSLGVTGARTELRGDLTDFLKRVRESTTAPTAVGFGISTPEQVRTLAPHADAVIVGSAIVREIERYGEQLQDPNQCDDAVEKIKNFVHQLSSALQ